MVNWFGTLVQWCGLRWAESVLRTRDVVGDPLLLEAARGAVISGCQQTFDKSPVEGCLPDAWNLETNTAYPAFIGPVVVENALRLLLERPSFCDARTWIVHGGGARAHISTRGVVEEPRLVPGLLTWTERYLVAGGAETFIAGLPKPTVVLVDGREIPEGPTVGTWAVAWSYGEEDHYLRIRGKKEDPKGGSEPLAAMRVEVRFTAAQ